MPRAACRSEVLHAGPAGDHEPGWFGTAIVSVPPSTALAGTVGVGVVDEVVDALPVPPEHAVAARRVTIRATRTAKNGAFRARRSERGTMDTD
jgi:hypothetical protein